MSPKPTGAFWLKVQPGEFYNVERGHTLASGGGATYFEIPEAVVPAFFDFLELEGSQRNIHGTYKFFAVEWKDPASGAHIEVGPKSIQPGNTRLRIMRQNRQFPGQQRHPAWTAARGFPKAPDDVHSTAEAKQYLPPGGVRIWFIRFDDGSIAAGFNQGFMPSDVLPDSRPLWGKGRGGYFSIQE